MNKSLVKPIAISLVVGGILGFAFFSLTSKVDTTAGMSEGKVLFYRNAMNPEVTSPVPAKDDMGMDYIAVYEESASEKPKELLFYRHPMNPDVTSPVPAKDSMGMDYVAVYSEEGSAIQVSGTVNIDSTVVQNMGVRTSFAVKSDLGRTVRSVGRVSFDEQRIVKLHPKVEGWIESIRVDKTGEKVKKNDILLSIYAPKLVSTQQEYLLALENLEALKESSIKEIREGAESLVKSSRERLELLDVPEHQIHELEKTKQLKNSLHIHAPASGTVISIGARQGEFVTPKTELYMLVDLNQVWVFADVYEYELPWVKEGDVVSMTLTSVPGKVFTGKLSYIYPYAEANSRTTKVRMVFDNQDLLLRPDMFAEVQIKSDVQKQAVIIPSEAVVRSGNRTQVFLVRAAGKFEPRVVTLGIESEGKVVVLSGLKEGDEIVSSAQFLVDSESKLREATAKMTDSLDKKKISSEAKKGNESSKHNAEPKVLTGDHAHD